jgi:uncharacterized membrane protein
VDGIVLHQLLQWHHMISSREPTSTVAGLEANTLADGLFHTAAWLFVALGVALLWRRSRRGAPFAPDRAFVGWLLVGWGAFNVADEIVFHALLDLHHIREGENELAYDLAFTVFGLALVAGGVVLARARARLARV